jgi:hypothetical protein
VEFYYEPKRRKTMATVRFSDELRGNIEKNARELFHKKLDDAKNIGQDWCRTVAEDYIQTVDKLLGHIPQDIRDQFILYGDQFEIKEFVKSNVDGDTIDGSGNSLLGVNISTNIKIPMPYKESDTVAKQLGFVRYKRGYSGSLTVVLDGDDPKWSALCDKAIERNKVIHSIKEERDKFVMNVRHIINTYSTLAPALKAWAPLWELVPQDKQERHKEIVERKRTSIDSVVSDMNLDQMTAVTVASKLRK